MENPLSPPPKDSVVLSGNYFNNPWMAWLSRMRDHITRQSSYEVSFNPTSIAANTVSRQTVTVTGLTTADIITVNPPALTSGLELIGYRVSAADTVTLTFWNSTGGAIDEAAGTYLIKATRK